MLNALLEIFGDALVPERVGGRVYWLSFESNRFRAPRLRGALFRGVCLPERVGGRVGGWAGGWVVVRK